tara:strand:+ start:1083 stop:1322 length:240 start_codon:yes stop_codon:yes gene_type:complete
MMGASDFELLLLGLTLGMAVTLLFSTKRLMAKYSDKSRTNVAQSLAIQTFISSGRITVQEYQMLFDMFYDALEFGGEEE